MHSEVQQVLSNLDANSIQHNTKNIWIPQFKIGDKKSEEDMRSEEPFKNLKVSSGEPPIFVQEYVNKCVFELYGLPETESHLTLERNANDFILDKPEFIVAVSMLRLEELKVDLPLCVAKVTKNNWKKVE